jgi:hypothetical protein
MPMREGLTLHSKSDRASHPFQVFSVKLGRIPHRLAERSPCAFSGQDPQLLRNCQCVFTFFSDSLIPFFKFLFGFRLACEKKMLSLSVDLDPIEVIMVTAVALVRKYSQCPACHMPSFVYLPNFGDKLARGGSE